MYWLAFKQKQKCQLLRWPNSILFARLVNSMPFSTAPASVLTQVRYSIPDSAQTKVSFISEKVCLSLFHHQPNKLIQSTRMPIARKHALWWIISAKTVLTCFNDTNNIFSLQWCTALMCQLTSESSRYLMKCTSLIFTRKCTSLIFTKFWHT